MAETLAFRKMAEIDLITNLEKISSTIPNRILKLEGFTLQDNQKEPLEIIISEVMANQTLSGIKTIGAKGPVICSGSFANNQNFLKKIENNCGYSVILEDNHLGICKGIANLISK